MRTRLLALGLALLLAAAQAKKESDWCHEQRARCEEGCRHGRVDFHCVDKDGERQRRGGGGGVERQPA